jgi:hypothetical protein
MRVLPTLLAVLAALSALVVAEPEDLRAEQAPTTSDDSELVLLISLSRHGSRAPNPTVKKHCPSNLKNMEAYIVPPEQLTERGMQQLEAAGKHIREVYVEEKGFLSPSFNGRGDQLHFESYFRADAANRCGQSAIALGNGLYPDGTGPDGYAKQPIPVFMQLPESEHDFTANVPCWKVMSENSKRYATSRGMQLVEQHRSTLELTARACGSEFYHTSDPVTAIKDVSDMLLFDEDEGLPLLEGMTTEVVKQLSDLAFQNLIERLYSTPRDVTTAIGGFPQLLLNNLNLAAAPSYDSATATKFYSYHCHRELLHGLGFMMGMRFKFDGLPSYNDTTALIPGTSLFFELHRKVAEGSTTSTPTYKHFVKFFVWSPKTERTQIKLDKCAWDCPIEDLNQIITSYIQSTGTWQEICTFNPTMSLDTQAVDTPTAPMEMQESDNAWLVLVIGGVAVIAIVSVKLVQRFTRRRSYRAL